MILDVNVWHMAPVRQCKHEANGVVFILKILNAQKQNCNITSILASFETKFFALLRQNIQNTPTSRPKILRLGKFVKNLGSTPRC